MRVVHFEIPADNPERAVRFYAGVFGWKLQKWEGPVEYYLAETGEKDRPGIDGAIMRRSGQTGVIDTIDVPSVDEYAGKVTAAGGKIVQPKTAVPGVGYVAYFKDTEGNVFGIFAGDMSAR